MNEAKRRKLPDDLLKVIRKNGWPVGPHGRSAFDDDDQLLLRHLTGGEEGNRRPLTGTEKNYTS